jgi:hypothetical protein
MPDSRSQPAAERQLVQGHRGDSASDPQRCGVGTEHAARVAAERYRIDGAVLLRSPTDFHSVSTYKQPPTRSS